jgi:hypothetical protein
MFFPVDFFFFKVIWFYNSDWDFRESFNVARIWWFFFVYYFLFFPPYRIICLLFSFCILINIEYRWKLKFWLLNKRMYYTMNHEKVLLLGSVCTSIMYVTQNTMIKTKILTQFFFCWRFSLMTNFYIYNLFSATGF